MNAEEFQSYAQRRGMQVVAKRQVEGLNVLIADGFTTKPPKESGFPTAYVTQAVWGFGSDYIRSYQEFFEWNKPGGRSEDRNIRISSVIDTIKETSKKKHLVTKRG